MGWLVNRSVVPAERRDPQVATLSPVSGFHLRRYPNWNAKQAVSEALYTNIYVYACARARATDLASLPIRVGADPDKPKDFDRQHPIAKLLGPAPGGATMNISARRLIAWTLVQYDITGRFAWEVAPPVRHRRDGVPFELWPIPSGRVVPVSSRGGANWFSHFEVEQSHGRSIVTPDRMVYYWRPGADDFREPESLLQAARLNVSIAVMQDRYDYAFLINDARPAAVVVHEQFAKRSERTSFRRQFLERHQGADNAGKVAFVETSENGATPKDSLFIQQLGLSQRDAEFIERYENQIRAICVAMATPLSRLADSSRRTYANAERETLNYWRNAIKPAGVELAEALNTALMPLVNDNSNVCWFDTTGVPELEPPARFAVGDIPDLLAARAITRNEARTRMHLEEIGPEGDEFEELPEPEPEPALPAAPAPKELEPARSASTSAIIAGLYRQMDDAVSHLDARLCAGLRQRANAKRGRQLAERDAQANSLLDETFWYDAAFAAFTSSMHAFVVATYAACGVEGSPAPGGGECQQWVRQRAAEAASRWVQAWMSRLDVPIVQAEERLVPQVIDRDLVAALYYSAESVILQRRVQAGPLSDVAVAVARGAVGLRDALATLT